MGALDELRKRIEGLNRGPLPPVTTGAELAAVRERLQRDRPPAATQPPPPLLYARHLASARGRPRPQHEALPELPHVALEEAVAGLEFAHGTLGKGYLVRTQVDELEGRLELLHLAFEKLLGEPGSAIYRRLARYGITALVPDDVLFVDLETTGLGGSPLFLVGVMVWEDDALVVRQYLARDYSEEAAVIAAFVELAGPKKLLVSFNGKSFDVPYLRLRAATNGIPIAIPLPHLDLLHECRRVWRGRLPNCRLQTLEAHVCGRSRTGDIPGHRIPEAYHAYVRTANAARIVSILEHNRMDLVTLADLMVRL